MHSFSLPLYIIHPSILSIMSHHISNAANIIQSRYTGAVLPFNDSEDQQAVIEVPRDHGTRARLNNDFVEKYGVHELANDYVPPVAPVVESVGVKRGRPTGDNFKEVYKCQRYKNPRAEISTGISRGPSFYGCGCTAELVAVSVLANLLTSISYLIFQINNLFTNQSTTHLSTLTLPVLLKNVVIKYKFGHVGHVPGSRADLQVVGVSDETWRLITGLLDHSLKWDNIKSMIRVDRSVLSDILGGNSDNIPESLRISYQTVYYLMKKCMEKRAQLDPDMVTSLRLWGERKIGPDGYYLERNLDQHQRGMYLFAFMSQWQIC
ncbi:hypothetical protein, partial, partial [Absidia glauca]